MALSLCACLLASLPGNVAYTRPGFVDFDPHQNFRSVGPFGSFGKGTEVQERDSVGLPAFTLRKDAPENTLVWANFSDGKDFVLGHAEFPGALDEKRFEFLDWTTARLDFQTSERGKTINSQAYFSRSFPGVLYTTDATEWSWKSGDLKADTATYRDLQGRLRVVQAGDTIGPLGAPWVLLWPKSGPIEPLLIRFEHRPTKLVLQNGLSATFDNAAGSIGVMPLYGVRRLASADFSSAAKDADFWSRALAAYPTGLEETFSLDDAAQKVRITDRLTYRTISDDWGTEPLKLAPVSPLTGVALANKYPVTGLSSPVRTSRLATLLGPWVYANATNFTYEIPVPPSRDDALTPMRVMGDPSRVAAEDKLDRLVAAQTIKPIDGTDGGLNLQLKEFSQSYPLLSQTTQAEIADPMRTAFDAAYSPENLQTVTDPVTGARYVMCNKIWCAGEAFDREWYTGRQLDATYEYNSWVDPDAAKRHWQAVQGLYAYFRIYNDWAWSGTLSSLFAYALCGDGMNFAMEGMLATARLAKLNGDDELWRDASYRASKEALCTYGSWFLSGWVKSIDYATWTDTSYDYQKKQGRYEIRRMRPDEVQTGFGLDIFSDYTGIKVFRNGSFWHASAAVYWNNMSEDRLYLQYLYPELYTWEFQTLPKLHPQWTDKDAIEKFTNQPYGSNMVNTHVDARTVLFGESPTELAGLMINLQPDIAPLYQVRSAEDLVESGEPQLWLPTDQGRVHDAVWDAQKGELSAKLAAKLSGRVTLDWRWPGKSGVSPTPDAGPKPSKVTLNSRPLKVQKIPGGFWRAEANVKAGESAEFAVTYGAG